MPFVAQIGKSVQTVGEATVEWEVRDFFSLSDKVDDYYDSPVFSFAESLWYFRLYPNFKLSAGCVGICLCKEDRGPQKTINYTFGYRYSGVAEAIQQDRDTFSIGDLNGLIKELSSRAELLERASGLPDNVLTIICRLKCTKPTHAKVSWSTRAWEVSRSMKSVLADGKRTDFTLKLGDREWPVHKAILESRCKYFANMFRHDWVENTMGEVAFEDIEEDALASVLSFIYSGDVETMSNKNVCEIYVAAHKFLLDDLKALCIECMKGDMCEEIVYKALVIADTYGEEDVRQSAIEYFMEGRNNIFDSVEWKEFKKNRPSIAADLLEETTKRERRKRRKLENYSSDSSDSSEE